MLEWVDDPALRMIKRRYPDVPGAAKAALIIEQISGGNGDTDIDAWATRLEETGAFEEKEICTSLSGRAW